LLAAGEPNLTAEQVQSLLGTPSDERLLDLIDALADHAPGTALRVLHQASVEAVAPVEMLHGLLDYLRDLMVLSVGAEDLLMASTPAQRPRLKAVLDRWPLDSVLAAAQILDQARGRLRGSAHGRLIIEVALLRVARLENLTELSDLVAGLSAL